MYIFGYGSLVNIASAQKSFKRKLQHEDFIPVVVHGYEKVWNAIETITFENEEKSSQGIFLNLNANVNTQTNGVLLRISEEEFSFLKKREKNYACIEIPHTTVEGFTADAPIYTFMTTNESKLAKVGDSNTYIPRNYIKLLEDGLAPFSEAFQKEFIDSYSNFPFEIKEGAYIFSDPIQNKYAKEGLISEE